MYAFLCVFERVREGEERVSRERDDEETQRERESLLYFKAYMLLEV